MKYFVFLFVTLINAQEIDWVKTNEIKFKETIINLRPINEHDFITPKSIGEIDNKFFLLNKYQPYLRIYSSKDFKSILNTITEGKGPGELMLPTQLKVSKNFIVIHDYQNRIFNYYDKNGSFVKGIKYIHYVVDFLIDNKDQIVCVSKSRINENKGLSKYSLEVIKPNEIIKIDSLIVNDFQFITEPIRSYFPIPYTGKILIALNKEGTLISLNTKTYEFNKYDRKYVLNDKFKHSVATNAVSKKDKEEFIKSLVLMLPNGEQTKDLTKQIINKFKFPDYKDFASQMIYDRYNGLLLVKTTRTEEMYDVIDVFNSEGKYLNTTKIETGIFNSPLAVEDGLIKIKYDDIDDAKLILYEYEK